MTSPDRGHIIISGTGRAGTTLLVQLFTVLGFDTGYSLSDISEKIDTISNAGLEPDLKRDRLPQVVKSPRISEHMAEWLARDDFQVEAVIIPMRDIFSAAESRRRVTSEAQRAGLRKPKKHAGGLWQTSNPKDQERQLALQFYQLLYPLIEHEIPVHFLHFPRFTSDPGYLFAQLETVFASRNIDHARLVEAMQQVVRPDLIHSFEPPEASSPVDKLQRLFERK